MKITNTDLAWTVIFATFILILVSNLMIERSFADEGTYSVKRDGLLKTVFKITRALLSS